MIIINPLKYLTLTLSALLLIQCTKPVDKDDSEEHDIWTTELVMDIHDSDIDPEHNILFGSIRIAGVTSDHRIIVSDYTKSLFYEFAADGSFLGKISSKGSGPGEIENISAVTVNQEDALTVYDGSNQRITVFEKGASSWQYQIYPFSRESRPSIFSMQPGPAGNLFNVMSQSFNMSNYTETNRQNILYLSDYYGNVLVDSVKTEPDDSFLLVTSGDGFAVRSMPGGFGLTGFFTIIDQRYIISARSDEPGISILDFEMNSESYYDLNIAKIPLTDEQKLKLHEDVGPSFQIALQSKMPEHKRVITNILSDNNRRIWIQISTHDDAVEDPNWIIMNLDGSIEAKLYIPRTTGVRQIKDDFIYANFSSEELGFGIRVLRVNKD